MNRRKISGIAALVAIVATGLVVQPTAEADPALSSETLGMYVGFNQEERFEQFEKALGQPFRWSVIMSVGKTPGDMRSASWGQLLGNDAYLPDVSDRVNLVITIPLAFGPSGLARTESGQETVGENLRDTAAGKWDDDYRVVAKNLKLAGYGDAVIRLGHEFDTAWEPHSARGNSDAYIAAFRHVHDVFERESSAFSFDWTSTRAGFRQYGPDAYPGDAYVDIVGLDIYYRESGPISDRVWENQYLPALQAHREFARTHGKPVSYPEWGRAYDDSSVFVDRMYSWFSSLPLGGPGGLKYHSYFNERNQDYDLQYLPKVRQRYIELFGSSGSGAEPASVPIVPPPPAGALVVELPDPPQSVRPSRGTAAQVTATLPPPVDQHAPTPNSTPATTAPIVTTPPNPVTTVPVGTSTASVEGTTTLPSIFVVRDADSLEITYEHADAKLYNIRHRPVDSTWWKWEVQTKATTFSLAGIGADTAHVVQVKAYVRGSWRDWNTVTVEPPTAAAWSALQVAAVDVSNGALYEPKVWSMRDGAAMTLNYWRPEAELYQVRHRPHGSAFWKWEKQTKATTMAITGLDASTAHVAEVRVYVDGRWWDWASITAEP